MDVQAEAGDIIRKKLPAGGEIVTDGSVEVKKNCSNAVGGMQRSLR